MAARHYLTMIDKKTGDQPFREQLLKNNKYFDDEFYEALGIELDMDGHFEKTEVDLLQFASEWHQFLHRHPDLLGFPSVEKDHKDNLSEEVYNKWIFYLYAAADSYELQIYKFLEEIALILVRNGAYADPDDRFLFTLECF